MWQACRWIPGLAVHTKCLPGVHSHSVHIPGSLVPFVSSACEHLLSSSQFQPFSSVAERAGSVSVIITCPCLLGVVTPSLYAHWPEPLQPFCTSLQGWWGAGILIWGLESKVCEKKRLVSHSLALSFCLIPHTYPHICLLCTSDN